MRFDFKPIVTIVCLLIFIFGCRKTEDLVDFTEEDEVLLGEKLSQLINDDAENNVISPENNTIPYGYANSRLNEIINSTSISKGEEFPWSIFLIDNDDRRAFALPGGYIYVTSGMIFFLENEDQFSGLIAHLVAHINESHITEALFFKYGVNNLRSLARSGGEDDLREIVRDLDLKESALELTRSNEIQADTLAITLLRNTDQSCESEALLFSRILDVQPENQTLFIQAHQITAMRIAEVEEVVALANCDTNIDSESEARFRSFRNSLP